jgi:hypothetical protein
MILPLLMAGWGALVWWIARFPRSPGLSTLIICVGLGLVLTPNLVASTGFLLTQWGISSPVDENRHWRGFHRVGFIHAYSYGTWSEVYDLAKLIRDNTTSDEKVLAPEATVLTYLSGRPVYPPGIHYVRRDGRPILHRALFPVPVAHHERAMADYDAMLSNAIQSGRAREGRTIAGPVAGYRIAELIVPSAHSSQNPPTTHP